MTLKRVCLAALTGLLALCGTQVQGAETVLEISNTEAAALLVQAGRFDEAKRVLAVSLQQNANDYEAIFILGLIAAAEKQYDTAIGYFRKILAEEPARERVRLELARAFFLQGDYENAERNFRFARAGDLPDAVLVNIDRFLATIQRVRRGTYDISVALADDTNVNGATASRQIDIYGLPFTLSDDARATSGTGIMLDMGDEWSPLLYGDLKARIGGRLRRLEYSGGDFDDMTVTAYAGPSLVRARWQIDTLATGFQRWYGNSVYNTGIGGRVGILHTLTPRIQIGPSFSAQYFTYETAPVFDGPMISADVQLGYTIGPISLIRFIAGISDQNSRTKPLSNIRAWFSVSYYRDLPYGFSVGIEPTVLWTHFKAPLAAFGVTRSDWTLAIRLDLLNRRIEYGGFAPRLSYIYVQQSSNVALYGYSRSQIVLGLTRRF